MEIKEAKRRAKSGPRILLARRLFLLILMFISTITTARLLSPRDYGLANMSAVILSFAQIFRDFGVSNAVLRKGTISQEELNMIFWFNAASTGVLSIIIICLAPGASWFYGEPIIQWTILVSVIGFLISGLALQHRAMISRDLRFSTGATIDIVSTVGGFIITLAIAFYWRNVWAIVIGNAMQSVISGVMAIQLSGWRPNRPSRNGDLLDLIKFGANSTVFGMSLFISNNAPSILIGRFLGPALLGQYNRGLVLYQIPANNVIQPVIRGTMPLLTRLRPHPEEYRAAYLGLIRKLSILLFPMAITLAFAAVPLTVTLLGPKWHDAGLVLICFMPALAGAALSYGMSDLLVTQDRAAELRNLGLYELALRLSLIAAGIPFGLVAVVIFQSTATLIVIGIRIYVIGRKGPISAFDQVRSTAGALVPMIGAGLLAGGASLATTACLPVVQAGVTMIAGVIGAMLACLSNRRSREQLGEVVETFLGYRIAKMLRLR